MTGNENANNFLVSWSKHAISTPPVPTVEVPIAIGTIYLHNPGTQKSRVWMYDPDSAADGWTDISTSFHGGGPGVRHPVLEVARQLKKRTPGQFEPSWAVNSTWQTQVIRARKKEEEKARAVAETARVLKEAREASAWATGGGSAASTPGLV